MRHDLCRHRPRDHQNVAAEAGVNHLIGQKGHLFFCRDKSEIANNFAWNMHRRFGVKFTELHKTNFRKCEPNISERYQYGALIDEGCHRTDVKAYREAIAELIRKRGGAFVRTQATGFGNSSGRLTGVRIGELVVKMRASRYNGRYWFEEIGGRDHVPPEAERGYHVVIADGGKTVIHPIMHLMERWLLRRRVKDYVSRARWNLQVSTRLLIGGEPRSFISGHHVLLRVHRMRQGN
ncbi:FAD-dependent oxidoreductase [Bradyrhizobium sp. 134]|uniref:FAD-dependent oxidoreductase n=1 Tax=unclassified Bradyrhizobium TaxID=2631580 RepID=UPI001FF743E0|nr:FAD-binding oxidoreductase [Bradyrhizobium sp. 37]MCK1771447.1 FAD-binding oxidoreductase [Bradyrhizobium sp. 134]